MAEKAKLFIHDKEIEMDVHQGTYGNSALDISKLYGSTGLITLDDGYANTGSTISNVTYIDGQEGILRYRGYGVEALAEDAHFTETAYLLIYGELPTVEQLEEFRAKIRKHTLLHEGMKQIYAGFPPDAHPMAILSSVVGALPIYCNDTLDANCEETREAAIIRMLAKMPSIVAFAYKQSIGQPFIYPQNDLSYSQNFLQMMFGVPSERYRIDPDFVEALNILLTIHADHGQNCSTSTVRMVGSSTVNLYSSISAGICALWGDLHGGANEACINMLETIQRDGGGVGSWVDRAKDPNDPFRLMGFGHRVYKNYDPRATIIRKICDKLLAKHSGENKELFDIAKELEEAALKDSYFVDRKLYPNVDFYSGIVYQLMGIPKTMFTALFALGRLPGWIAHWRELHESSGGMRIHRPRQLYRGEDLRQIVPREERK